MLEESVETDFPTADFHPKVTLLRSSETVGSGTLHLQIEQDEYTAYHILSIHALSASTSILRLQVDSSLALTRHSPSSIGYKETSSSVPEARFSLQFSSEEACDITWNLLCQWTGVSCYVDTKHSIDDKSHNLTIICSEILVDSEAPSRLLSQSPSFLETLKSLWNCHGIDSFAVIQNQRSQIAMIVKQLLKTHNQSIAQILMSEPAFDLILQVFEFSYGLELGSYKNSKFWAVEQFPISSDVQSKIKVVMNCLTFLQNFQGLQPEMTTLSILLPMIIKSQCSTILSLIDKSSAMQSLIKHFNCFQDASKILRSFLTLLGQQASQACRQRITDKLYLLGVIPRLLSPHYSGQSEIPQASQVYTEKAAETIQTITLLAKAFPTGFVQSWRYHERNAMTQYLLQSSLCDQTSIRTAVWQLLKGIIHQCKASQFVFDIFSRTFIKRCSIAFPLAQFIVEVSHLMPPSVFEHLAVKSFDILSLSVKETKVKSKQLLLVQTLSVLLKSCATHQGNSKMTDSLYNELIRSGFLPNCLELCDLQLKSKWACPNAIASSMLQILKDLRNVPYNRLHRFLQNSRDEYSCLSVCIDELLQNFPSSSQANSCPNTRLTFEDDETLNQNPDVGLNTNSCGQIMCESPRSSDEQNEPNSPTCQSIAETISHSEDISNLLEFN